MGKLLEAYIIPQMGEIRIYEEEKGTYKTISRDPSDFIVLDGCKTRSESRRSAEAYLRGAYIDIIRQIMPGEPATAGWIKQYQTYPEKKNKKN